MLVGMIADVGGAVAEELLRFFCCFCFFLVFFICNGGMIVGDSGVMGG